MYSFTLFLLSIVWIKLEKKINIYSNQLNKNFQKNTKGSSKKKVENSKQGKKVWENLRFFWEGGSPHQKSCNLTQLIYFHFILFFRIVENDLV